LNKKEIIFSISECIKKETGDLGRNQYLLKRLNENKSIFSSDKKYLENLLGIKIDVIEDIKENPRNNISQIIDTSVFLNPNLIKCIQCKNEIKLDEKSTRHGDNWYHSKCYEVTPNITKIEKEKKMKVRIKKIKMDMVQVLITVAIFVFLVVSVYFILGPLSMVAMGLGGGLLVYHLISAKSKIYSKNKHGNQGPSVFLLFLILSPFIIGGIIAYEGYSLLESPIRITLLWAMTISFWSTMLFVPMAVISKHREELQPELQSYPTVSVIIPAYNEEKVILHTIEALLETKYPKKEIIFVDDGSKDRTLDIAMQYKDRISVLHKENGGKASALNYGLIYAKGEIIVIVDADTIIGRNSLKEIVKGFQVDEHVAAVAGNIKVRNRVNMITKCQALEYITGIQIVRRAFDIVGSITIVPGALGAFRKSILMESGSYGKDTIVEDFDQTIKLLKAGLITQGSTKATAYTEAPNTLHDFIAQRKRWYRGNIQVLRRHGDALTNPRYGHLQRLSFPYLLLGMLVTPIIGFVATINAVIGVIQGDGLYVLEVMIIFTVVHYLMSALAIRIDDEDPKLLLHAGFLIFGFKQLVDFLLLKAIIEQLANKKATWTSAQRIGI